MDGVPLHLQERLYADALRPHVSGSPRPFGQVSAVSRLAREAALRSAVLANQQEADLPFDEEGQDGPPPVPTWRVRRMVCFPAQALAAAVALQRTAQRFSQLRHVSLDLSTTRTRAHYGWGAGGSGGAEAAAGLHTFMQNVAPSLARATRLTIRAPASTQAWQEPPLAHWQQLRGTPMAAACTRLDLTVNASTAFFLLGQLGNFFPAVRSVRVHTHPALFEPPVYDGFVHNYMLVAPACLTHLCALFGGPAAADLVISRSRGLQSVVLGPVPQTSEAPPPRLTPSLAMPLWLAAPPPPTALCTIRGFPRLSSSRPFPELQTAEATVDEPSEEGVREWLRQIHTCAPKLQSMRLRVQGMLMGPAMAEQLRAWAAVRVPFSVTLVNVGAP